MKEIKRDIANKNVPKSGTSNYISTDVKEKYERLLNDVYPGVTMYVRDVDLPPACAEKYKTGMIIREAGFTDASMRIMGMKTTHRFAVLSNHMANFSAFEHGTNWGLCVAQRDSYFKVLDIYQYK